MCRNLWLSRGLVLYLSFTRCEVASRIEFSVKRPGSVRGIIDAAVGEGGDLRTPVTYETDGFDVSADGSTTDGALVSASLPESLLEELIPGIPHALFLQLFTVSYASPFEHVEKWLTSTGVAPVHAPLRLTHLFDSFYSQQENTKGIIRDDHGDSCIGYLLKGELCLQAMSCIPLSLDVIARRELNVWLPLPVATNYRLEAYLSANECAGDLQASPASVHSAPTGAWRVKRLADAPAGTFQGDFLMIQRRPLSSGHLRFRSLYVDEPSAWWAELAAGTGPLEPTQCWMDMMGNALVATEGWLANPHALFLEFGVASGRSLSFISGRLQNYPHVTVHAFDSFEGIPQGWHRYTEKSFGMDGKPPEIVEGLKNVKLHIGYFTQTLSDLDEFRVHPVAFAHIDSDLFASAREVLSYLRCQLVPGTVLVFDEWFNYAGWQKGGEYRAWNLFAENYGVKWRPLGFHFEQAVPIVVESLPEGCHILE